MANEIKLPDLGVQGTVDVIEINVPVGQPVEVDSPLMTLESDKASMEIPSPSAGVITEWKIKVGDKVSSGQVVALIEGEKSDFKESQKPVESKKSESEPQPKSTQSPSPKTQPQLQPQPQAHEVATATLPHAGPGVRRFARELGVSLKEVFGSGPKGRILKIDIEQFVKRKLADISSASVPMGSQSLAVAPLTSVDFSVFGPIETTPLSRIKKLSGGFLHRNWVTIPHITQFDEADITEMEAFRLEQQKILSQKEPDLKLTPLVFIMKAVVNSLKAFPSVNASLSANGNELILKQYFHIGVAVDTPNGLVVPVIRDVDQKGLMALARELKQISQVAREGKLTPKEMQGGCFSISSLGGIGGTLFTPIINAPEVAILGVSRSQTKPIYQNGNFVPRLMLPLALSYDHRVIDGAEGARFITHLSAQLSDIRRLLL